MMIPQVSSLSPARLTKRITSSRLSAGVTLQKIFTFFPCMVMIGSTNTSILNTVEILTIIMSMRIMMMNILLFEKELSDK